MSMADGTNETTDHRASRDPFIKERTIYYRKHSNAPKQRVTPQFVTSQPKANVHKEKSD
jgi:hypothetical protein